MNKLIARTLSAAVVTTMGLTVLSTTPAQAEHAKPRPGTNSLAAVLAADGTKLDRNPNDFDITEAAVLAVIDAKPDSPVALLTRGRVRLTAFIPTDQAFRELVNDLTGKAPHSEAKVLKAVQRVADIDTLETILLYHVVPGATLTSPKVLKAARAGTPVTTAQGQFFRALLIKGDIRLRDKDYNSRNPRAVAEALDINRGNRQIAHGIDRVLRPIDL